MLREHKERKLPYTTDNSGVMFFASPAGKLTYNFLSKADRSEVQHCPAVLTRHMLQSGIISSESIPTANTPSVLNESAVQVYYAPTSYTHPTRPLASKNNHALANLYSKNINNLETLKKLQDELSHRSSVDVLNLKQRADLQIQKLCVQQSDIQCSTADPEPRLASRPYQNETIQALQAIFDRATNNRPVIEQLETELEQRKTVKSAYLLAQVRERLAEFKPVYRVSNKIVVNEGAVQAHTSETIGLPEAKTTFSANGRPWIAKSIDFLKRHQLSHSDDLETQKDLLNELTFRSTRQATLLKTTVAACIADLTTSNHNSANCDKTPTTKPELMVEISATDRAEQSKKEALDKGSINPPAMADLLKVRANPADIARKVKEKLEQTASHEDESKRLSGTVNSMDAAFSGNSEDNESSGVPPEISQLAGTQPANELVADLSLPYARIQATLQKELDKTDFRMLLMRSVQDRQYNEIGQSLDMSRRDVRRRLKELTEEISVNHESALKPFARSLDEFLNENEDDTSVEEAAEHMKLTGARLKFLTVIAQPFFNAPCQVHRDRLYRKVQMLA